MPYRLVLAPKVLNPKGTITSKVQQFTVVIIDDTDPENEIERWDYLFVDPVLRRPYNTVNYTVSRDWVLVLVAGQDFSPILADPEILDFLEQSFTREQRNVVPTLRMRDIPGMNQGRLNNKRSGLDARFPDLDFGWVVLNTTIQEIVRYVQNDPTFDMASNWVTDE